MIYPIRFLAVFGLCFFAANALAATSEVTSDPTKSCIRTLQLDLATGTLDCTLPFDVPFYIEGAISKEVESVEILYAVECFHDLVAETLGHSLGASCCNENEKNGCPEQDFCTVLDCIHERVIKGRHLFSSCLNSDKIPTNRGNNKNTPIRNDWIAGCLKWQRPSQKITCDPADDSCGKFRVLVPPLVAGKEYAFVVNATYAYKPDSNSVAVKRALDLMKEAVKFGAHSEEESTDGHLKSMAFAFPESVKDYAFNAWFFYQDQTEKMILDISEQLEMGLTKELETRAICEDDSDAITRSVRNVVLGLTSEFEDLSKLYSRLPIVDKTSVQTALVEDDSKLQKAITMLVEEADLISLLEHNGPTITADTQTLCNDVYATYHVFLEHPQNVQRLLLGQSKLNKGLTTYLTAPPTAVYSNKESLLVYVKNLVGAQGWLLDLENRMYWRRVELKAGEGKRHTSYGNLIGASSVLRRAISNVLFKLEMAVNVQAKINKSWEQITSDVVFNVPVRASMTVLGGSTSASFETRAKRFITADIGLAATALPSGPASNISNRLHVIPYAGVNFNFFPLNREASYGLIKRRRDLARVHRLRMALAPSFMIGITLDKNAFENSEYNAPLIGDSYALMTGFGVRLNDFGRLSLGSMFSYQKDSVSPLVTTSSVRSSFYVSLSIDADLTDMLGSVKSIFTK